MHLTVGSPTALNINFAIDIYKTNLNRRTRSKLGRRVADSRVVLLT